MLRRRILILGCAILAGCCGTPSGPEAPGKRGILLNDVHSRLNPTAVSEIFYPETAADVARVVGRAKREGRAVSISGGKHAMGGQQFGEGTLHISMSRMDDVLAFDKDKGLVTVEAGITWPALIDYLIEAQEGRAFQWGIKQKQTGANHLSIGGALSANAHGRGLHYKPIIDDVAAFTLVNADAQQLRVSRDEHPELFGLVIGGYGLFGVITTVDLKLAERQKIQRMVTILPIEDLPEQAAEKIRQGFLYGDYQYKTDSAAEDFMTTGVLSAYKPVAKDTPVTDKVKVLSPETWNHFMLLAHTDKAQAFDMYSRYYLATDGQVYWSDTHQLSYYDDGYHEYLKQAMDGYTDGSLMITEVYVPRDDVPEFIGRIRDDARAHDFDIVYGTLRLIQRDEASFLAWAKQDYACIIFNLRVEHSDDGIAKAKRDFQRIIDRALEFGGSYFLTYHRWARKDQLLATYPQFPEFLERKLAYDPEERFQSEWYRYYKDLLKED